MIRVKANNWGRVISAVLAIVLFLLYGSNAMAAQATSFNKQAANVNGTAINNGPNDPEELEKFCDDYFAKRMKRDNVPGAAISVVKNGKVLFAKGYGYANSKSKVKVDPDKTAFNICSTGKLFTGTAVMQLYEQGEIKNLNDNVNPYLHTIKVNNKYSEPVTFSNLLTHTSGLDDGSIIGGASRTEDGVLSYEDYLKKKLNPGVIREPGLSTRYSNLGYSLLGFLVQEISGIPFADYIKTNILQPLGMMNSTAGTPPENLAIPHMFDGKTMQPQTNEVFLPALGEGCVYSTAGDMAKFMIAHLQNGSYNGKSILTEEIAQLMHQQHFTNNSKLPGMCYTFLESNENNQHAIKHEGADASGYTTTLYLLPEYDLGFFVAINTLSALPISFEAEFLDHYFPGETRQLSGSSANYEQTSNECAGTYRSYDDISLTTIIKIMALFSSDGEMTIINTGDGTLFMRGTSFERQPIAAKLVPAGDLLFERADDNSYIAFKRDRQGAIAYAFNNEPQKTFEKIHWYETQGFNLILLAACMLIFIAGIIGILFAFFRRRIRKTGYSITKLELTSNVTLWTVCMLNVVCIIAFSLMIMLANYEIQYGLPLIGYLSLGGLLLGSILSIGVVACCVLLWLKKRKTLTARIIYTIAALSCLAFTWFLNYWNLLGFKY